MRIFFSVGEPSGDLHAANLIRELRRQRQGALDCLGYGGPHMEAAGCQLLHHLTDFALMGIGRVFRHLAHFRRLLGQVDQLFRVDPPAAVVLVDYPGFNWHVARLAKRHGIPVFYYGVPQLWAWAPWRIGKMRRRVDHALCLLPFEPPWLSSRGCRATFVGHPFFDEVQRQRLDASFMRQYDDANSRLLVLLPGSRDAEVHSNLETLLRTASIVQRRLANVAVAVAAFKPAHAQTARQRVAQLGLRVDVIQGRTPELIQLADACAACSGSVSLELLARRKPAVILYRLPRWKWLLQSAALRVRYITLVNLLAAQDIRRPGLKTYDPDAVGAEPVPYPEYLTWRDVSSNMAARLCQWLENPAAHQAVVDQLNVLADQHGQPGASARGAAYILEHLPVSPGEAAVSPTLRRAA